MAVLLSGGVSAQPEREKRRREGGNRSERSGRGGLAPEVVQALASSDLVYLSPIKSNGNLSRCQSEVWFVRDENGDILVASVTQAWRVEAVRKGLSMVRMWVGDYGVASKSEGRYLSLPSLSAEATIETNPDAYQRALKLFGAKYKTAWVFWRRRFTRGLQEGSRTLIRYRPV